AWSSSTRRIGRSRAGKSEQGRPDFNAPSGSERDWDVFGNPGTTETTFLAAVAASKATYVLALHKSSAVGVAAGYALMTGKPSVVSLHTYPGLANGMFNMPNALTAGIPLLMVNGQQDSRFLIHNPDLGAPNTRLAETATKYAYEVSSVD